MGTCKHNWVWQSETKTTVTHKCSKCQDTYTQNKHHRLLVVLALLLVAACLGYTIIAGRPA